MPANRLVDRPFVLHRTCGKGQIDAPHGPRLQLANQISLLPALILAVPRYGAPAAAFIWITLNLGYVLLGIKLMHSKLLQDEVQSWYIRDIFIPLLPSLALITLMRLALPDDLSRTVIAAILIGATAIIYGINAFSIIGTSSLPQHR